jgi:hypothetical protein
MRSQFAAVGITALLFISAKVDAAAPVLGPILNTANGHQYWLLGSDTWTGDEASAVALGGTLATVRNSQENAWIYSQFMPTSQHNIWIGLNDPSQDAAPGSVHSADFVWASGESASYRNWAAGEPNNNNNAGEWYTLMAYTTFNQIQPLQWNDVTNDQGIAFGVAEVVPEPVSVWMIGLIPALLLGRRARRPLRIRNTTSSIRARIPRPV